MEARTLREAWLSTLGDLGAERNRRSLLIGPHAELLADQLPAPSGGAAPGVATLNAGPVPTGAAPDATGFETGSFETAVVLSAWESPGGIGPVVAEAVRVVRPGGTVWVGEIDAGALTGSAPAARRYGLLYRSAPAVADAVRFEFRAAGRIGVEAVRAGLSDVTETKVDFPSAVVDSIAEGVEAVRSGVWPGSAALDTEGLDRLLERVADSLGPPTRFPVLLTLPWIVVRGNRP